MIPSIDNACLGQLLDARKVHDHAIFRDAVGSYHGTCQGYLDRVAMAMQMAAVAFVIGDAMTGIEFETAGDLHGGGCMMKS